MSSFTPRRIAFIGATGLIGRPVALALHEAGHQVRAGLRQPDRAPLPEGIELSEVDILLYETVEPLLRGCQDVYLNLSVLPDNSPSTPLPEREGIENVLRAAKAVGVERICLLSSLVMDYQGQNGVDWWVFDVKQRAVKMIKDSGLGYVIFKPSAFMDNFRPGGPQRQGKSILLVGDSDQPMHWVSGDDYGRLVAKVLGDPDANRVEVPVQGPEALTPKQAAERFIAASPGQGLKTAKTPAGVLRFLGMFIRPLNYVYKITEALARNPERMVSGQVWERYGRPEMTIEAFAHKQAAESTPA